MICVCSAGKHRSVFLSRMLHHINRIVFHLMRLRTRHDLQWICAAERRVLQEQKSTHGAGARQRTRQQPLVLHRIKALFFFNQPRLEHVVSLNLTDQLFNCTAKDYFHSNASYVVGTRKFLGAARINGAYPVEDWISDALTTTTNIYGVILLWLALDKHWFRYMQELMNSFPDCCSLCEKRWRLNTSLESIIEDLERCERQGHRFCLTPEDIRFIGCNSDAHMRFDADDTQQTTASGSVSLMTAAGSESLPVNENLESCERQGHRVCLTPEDIRFIGCNSDAHMTFDADDTQQTTASGSVSLVTAAGSESLPVKSRKVSGSVSLPTAAGDQSARSSEACKRPAWADITDAAESPEGKNQRKVGFVEESPDSSSSEAPEDAYDVLVLQCDLRNKVLLRHGTQRVTAREDSTCLLWANSKRQKFRLQEEDDISALVNGMEFLLLNNEDLQSEMKRLDMTISESNLYPTPCQKESSALHRLQFYLFLHMWSVLKRDYSFFVSSKLLRLATLPLQAEFNYDAWTIISRYCYLLWLHRTDGPDVWSQSMMTLLLPDSEEWDMWWKREQL